MTDVATTSRAQARGWRPSRTQGAWYLLAVAVVALALTPLVVQAVDWGMDGRLTPGQWEPGFWITGTFISAIYVGLLGSPVLLLLPVVVSVVVARRMRQPHVRCPSCSSASTLTRGVCSRCGPLPPRAPGETPERVGPIVVESTARILGHVALFAALAIPLAALLCWVHLEMEEDAFGERARAAAAGGATDHEETSDSGSMLAWSADRGYWSHRD